MNTLPAPALLSVPALLAFVCPSEEKLRAEGRSILDDSTLKSCPETKHSYPDGFTPCLLPWPIQMSLLAALNEGYYSRTDISHWLKCSFSRWREEEIAESNKTTVHCVKVA